MTSRQLPLGLTPLIQVTLFHRRILTEKIYKVSKSSTINVPPKGILTLNNYNKSVHDPVLKLNGNLNFVSSNGFLKTSVNKSKQSEKQNVEKPKLSAAV